VLSGEAGALACGEVGAGRLMEPDALVLHVLAELGPKIA
jgi:phosphopantothenoylcysteine synthetase/decarboxylase